MKHGETRYHPDIGPCNIYAVEGRLGFLVAVAKGPNGQPTGVYAVDSLDERGWSNPRKKRGWQRGEQEKALRLRRAGMTHSEIAKEMKISRPVAGRMVKGVPQGEREEPLVNAPISEEDKNEIFLLNRKGWRSTVIANWIGCSDQAVRDIVAKANGAREKT